jgi:hypothetical protein
LSSIAASLVLVFAFSACGFGASEAEPTATPGPTYSLSEGLLVITQAEPNEPGPDDPREPWLGSEAWISAVQEGQAYIDEYPEPQNVQILTDMTTAEIWDYMQEPVSGALGVSCQYCHDINNYAADPYPEKVSARLMLVMMRDLNDDYIPLIPEWRGNYVQCATCHQNQPLDMPAFSPQYDGLQEVDTHAVDPDADYVLEHPSLNIMLAMNDWFENNWNRFVLPRRVPIDLEDDDLRTNYVSFDRTYYNVPNCYTCHAGERVPPAAINQSRLTDVEAERHTILPPVLRGISEE